MAHKTLIDGNAYEISGGKALVDGTAYSIKNGKTLVDGTAYEIGWSVQIGDLPVGSSVFMNVGYTREFLVVHQGLPDATLYDSSCDGTWLLMKNVYDQQYYDDVNSYLSDTFFNSIPSGVQDIIKQVKIPYAYWYSSYSYLNIGDKGRTCKLFSLSCAEVNYYSDYYYYEEGTTLDYFKANSRSNRIAYNMYGTAQDWWVRSINKATKGSPVLVSEDGAVGFQNAGVKTLKYVRPALILPSDTKIDENFNVIA